MTERCVCCGEIIPEGRQVCRKCEKGSECLHVWVFDGMKKRRKGKRFVMKCRICGETRIDVPIYRLFEWEEKTSSGLLSEE